MSLDPPVYDYPLSGRKSTKEKPFTIITGEVSATDGRGLRVTDDLRETVQPIKYSEAQEKRDLMTVVHAFTTMNQCIGGRTIMSGYTCPHCGSSNPNGVCLQPYEDDVDPMREIEATQSFEKL